MPTASKLAHAGSGRILRVFGRSISDAEAAKTGEYGLCDDIKILTHWPKIEEWEAMSPGRTALVCDDDYGVVVNPSL